MNYVLRHLSHEKQIRNKFLGGRILTDSVFNGTITVWWCLTFLFTSFQTTPTLKSFMIFLVILINFIILQDKDIIMAIQGMNLIHHIRNWEWKTFPNTYNRIFRYSNQRHKLNSLSRCKGHLDCNDEPVETNVEFTLSSGWLNS